MAIRSPYRYFTAESYQVSFPRSRERSFLPARRAANALRTPTIIVTPLDLLGIVTAVSLRGAERRGNPFSKYCVFVDCLEINGTFRKTDSHGRFAPSE